MRRIPWVALATLAVGIIARLTAFLEPVSELLPGCAFKRWTGLACPTCGMTRCLMALGRWDWRAAFHWHPVAAVCVALLPALALWDLRRAWRGDPYPPLPDAPAARATLWLILLGSWVLQVARGI